MDKRTRRSATAILIAVAASLLVWAGGPANAAATVQDGPVNYAGPGPCPVGTTDCLIAAGDVDVVQTGSSNTVDCRGANCNAVQSGTSATNKATCANSTTGAASDQRCNVTQTGGANEITANLSASPATGLVNLANVLQQNEQRLVTDQTGTTNKLTVNATIDQQATSVLDASTPGNHTQSTLQSSTSKMVATASNTATLTFNRTQTSSITSGTPTQLQDTAAGAGEDAGLGLGNIRLEADTPGTNAIKVRANDNKTQNATSLNFGTSTQRQGREGGGWIVDLSGTDTGTENAGEAVDVDLGTPGSNEGVTKTWTQSSQGALGAAITRVQEQIDDIKLPLLGLSPKRVNINGRNRLTAQTGANHLCRAESAGHADIIANGALRCDVTSGTDVKSDEVTWASQTWGHDLTCTPTECSEDGDPEVDIYGIKIKIEGGYSKNGVIPVAVLSQPDNNAATVDDASQIDPSKTCFGTAEGVCDSTPSGGTSLADEDADGAADDLKLHYEANETGLKPTSTQGCLRAETYDGRKVQGCAPLPK